MLPPPTYEGLRVDRAYQATDTRKTIGTPDAWSNVTIPDATAVDPQSTRVAGEIAAFAAARCAGCATNTWVNATAYTPQIYRVPADQPLRPVRWCRTYSAISDEDCALVEVRHALGLELPSTRYGDPLAGDHQRRL